MTLGLKSLELTPEQADRRKFLFLEVVALMSLRLLPELSKLLFVKPPASLPFQFMQVQFQLAEGLITTQIVSNTLTAISIIGIFLFVIYTSGDPLSKFGIKKPGLADVLPFIAALFVTGSALGLQTYFTIRSGAFNGTSLVKNMINTSFFAPYWLIGLYAIAAAMLTQLVYSGYLIPRLRELSGSVHLAIFAQALLCTIPQFRNYEFGMVFAWFGAHLMIGMIFQKWNRLWPLVAANAIATFAFGCYWLPKLTR